MRPSRYEYAGGGPAFLALAAYWAEVMGGAARLPGVGCGGLSERPA